MKRKHPIYVVNLEERRDRLIHIQNEFNNRDEFELQIIPTERHFNGALGLWQNIIKIIDKAQRLDEEYLIICEDDHTFTNKYEPIFFEECIFYAQQKKADILLGGVSWFDTAIQISPNLFWT
jgi:GR25 family glycosyltransferase involved in LPS biosynthesis